MKSMIFATAALAAIATGAVVARAPEVHTDEAPVVHVYKSPSCVCCGKWVTHMQEAGFSVEVHQEANVLARKQELGVPQSLYSCHTSVVEGHVVEGHVPAGDVRRMLQDSSVDGIGVGGMPAGSPGMMEDGSPFRVHAFDATGTLTVFADH